MNSVIPLFLSFAVYDKTDKGDKPMGSAMFNIANVLAAKGNTKGKHAKGGGTIFVKIQKYEEKGTLRLQLKGIELKSTEGLGLGILTRPNPFFEIHKRSISGSNWDLVHRSAPVKNTLDPVFSEAVIDLGTLCRGKLDLPLFIRIFAHDKKGKHEDMGGFETSVNGLVAAKNFSSTQDINQADLASAFTLRIGKNKKEMGQVVVLRADLIGMETVARSQDPAPSEPPKQDPAPSEPPKQDPAPTIAAAPIVPEVAVAYTPPAPAPAPHSPQPPTAYYAPQPTAAYSPQPTAAYYAPQPTTTYSPQPPAGPPSYTPPPSDGAPFVPPGVAAANAHQHYTPPPPPPTFEAYIEGGCLFNLAVAIDFSASNGDPRQMGNLHYASSWGDDKNEYERALHDVGSVLAKHDTEQRHPFWGFSGKFQGQIRQSFQCGPNAEVQGIDGIQSAYRSMFTSRSGMSMSEPTTITDVIKTAAHYAKKKSEQARYEKCLSYTVLMIITDGKLEDFTKEGRTIYDANDAPMSIVAVGVGSADFTGMRYLNDIDRNGRKMFNFLPYDVLKSNPRMIEKVTMEKVSEQLVQYFTSHGIKPGKKVAKDIVFSF
mmetsp:Transcript_12909/g.17335  ORF Transcript_12909/g.17335 Transcript_12909/m.17335 type:complete len:597 (+) Transcript_12909:343-2133(+)